MSITQISPNSVMANPVDVNPQVKAEQATAASQVSQDAQKTANTTKTDSVTISKQAVQMLASDGDSAAREIKESAAEKAGEILRGKK
jgi:hypothetical protein